MKWFLWHPHISLPFFNILTLQFELYVMVYYNKASFFKVTFCMGIRAGLFSSQVSRVGGKTNQIDAPRLGPGSFASKVMECFLI